LKTSVRYVVVRLAYAGESNIPSKNVVNDDGNEDNEDGEEGPALAEVVAPAAATIVATDSAVTALFEIDTCFSSSV
jgi:hypothetical protein